MNKITFYLSLLFLMAISSHAQVQVGYETNITGGYYNDGGMTASFKVPFYAPFGYSYGQSIYLNSDINATGTITTIQWYCPGTFTYSKDLVVYLGHTSKTKFDNAADFVPLTNLTQVYAGSLVKDPNSAWQTITLTTPFAYNGTDNLVVAVDENTPDKDSFGEVFRCSKVLDYRSITSWASSKNVDPAAPYSMLDPAYGGTTAGYTNYVPNVIFGGITALCGIPKNLKITNLTSTTATVSWDVPMVVPTEGSDYYVTTSSTPPNMFTTPTGHIKTGNSVDLSPLTPGTSYNIWIRNLCTTDLPSAWVQQKFKTSCLAVNEFSENFDSVTIKGDLPTCWTKILKGNSVVGAYNYEPAVSAPNTAEINNFNSAADGILISPEVTNLANGTHRLVFYTRGNNCVLEIGTLNKASDDAVFTAIATFPITGNMTKQILNIPASHVGDKYIGFRLNMSKSVFASGAPSPWADIENVAWEAAPSCADASKVKILSTTTTEAYLGWDLVNANQYQIVYGDKNQTNPNVLTPLEPTSTLNQLLTNLSAGAGYNVWIRSICNGNLGSWQGPVTFYTSCNPVAVFSQDFNTAVNKELPVCWGKIIRGAAGIEYSTIETQSDYGTDNNNTVVVLHSSPSVSTDDVILVSPAVSTLNLGTYRLRFFAKKNPNNVTLQIGTLSTNTNEAKFTNFQNVALTEDLKEYFIDFTDYLVSDKFIGIRMNNADKNSFVTIDKVIWEVAPLCADVAKIKLTDLKPHSAVIGWELGMSESNWDLVYGPAASTSDPNTLTPIPVKDIPNKGISELSASTDYKVWVRSVCSDTNLGGWIGPFTFTTPCEPVSTLNENFEGVTTPNLPLCWTKLLVNAAPVGNGIAAYINTVNGSLMPDVTKAVVLNSASTEPDAKITLVTPYLSNLGEGTYRLRFKLKGNAKMFIGTLGSNLDTAAFSTLETIMPTSNPMEYVINFDTYMGSDHFIGFRLSTEAKHAYDEIDNIVWEPIPPCQDVINLKQVESTMTTITVTWDANAASDWQYAFGDLSTVSPDALTPEMTNTPSKIFGQNTPLQPGTSYKIWVRSFCHSNSKYGNWNGPIVVKTQCVETNVPYVENFESAQTPNLPECTSSINLADEPYSWYVGNNPGYGFGSKALIYNSDNYVDANAWFFTRGITLEGGKNYNVSYRYGGASEDTFYYENKLKVMYGQLASPSAMTYLVKDYPSFAVKNPVQQTINITPATTGVYYIGFNVYSPNNSNFMFIDDINVDVNLATDQFEMSQLTYYPNPTNDVLNINNDSDIKSVSVCNILGQEVLVKTVNSQSTKIDMSNLSSGTYLVKIATENAIKTIKAVKQ